MKLFLKTLVLLFIFSCKKEQNNSISTGPYIISKSYLNPLILKIDNDSLFSLDTTISLEIDVDKDLINDFYFTISEGTQLCNDTGEKKPFRYIGFGALNDTSTIISSNNLSMYHNITTPIHVKRLDTLPNAVSLTGGFSIWSHTNEIISTEVLCIPSNHDTLNDGMHYLPIAMMYTHNNYCYGWIKFRVSSASSPLATSIKEHVVIEVLGHALQTMPGKEIIVDP